MKKALLLILAVCSLAITSCKKTEEAIPDYYIKYRIYSTFGFAIPLNATYTDETGNPKHVSSNNHSFSYEYVVGPVANGFCASLSSGGGLQIFACRGSGPWMLKAEGTGTITYTIDF